MDARLAAALVAAAISLKAPLQDAAKQFDARSPGEAITFNFGASGQLAAQIEQGAPVDLFVAASTSDVDRLAKAGRIDDATRTAVAGNRLVVVFRHGIDPPADLADLVAPRFARVAIGNPKTVPAGRYARESLLAADALTPLEPRFVYAENARQILDVVARGEADAGIVYVTDVPEAGASVAMAFKVPDQLHGPIVYEGAVVAGAPGAARARAFLDFLASPDGRGLFAQRGFLPPRAAAPK